MGKRKVFSKKELKKAWKKGNETFSGAAKELGIHRRTFKRLWENTPETPETKPTDGPTFRDPEVQKIYQKYYENSSLREKMVVEHIEKIEQLRLKVKTLNQELEDTKINLEKAEHTLYNLKLGGL